MISDDDIEPSGSHLFHGSVRTDLLKRSAVGFVSFFHVHFLWNFLSFFPRWKPLEAGGRAGAENARVSFVLFVPGRLLLIYWWPRANGSTNQRRRKKKAATSPIGLLLKIVNWSSCTWLDRGIFWRYFWDKGRRTGALDLFTTSADLVFSPLRSERGEIYRRWWLFALMVYHHSNQRRNFFLLAAPLFIVFIRKKKRVRSVQEGWSP